MECHTRPGDAAALSFDHFADDISYDPYPVYKHLRENCPVAWSEKHGGFWVVTSYQAIDEVYHKPEVFSSYPNAIPANIGQPGRMIPLEVDPPEHTAYRKVLNPYFGPAKVRRELERDARDLIGELLDSVIAKGECDFVRDVAKPYASTLFCSLVGWPMAQRQRLGDIADKVLMVAGNIGGDEAALEQGLLEIGGALMPFFWELIESHRKEPQDDLVGMLVNARYEGERPLDDVELLNILFVLFIGGLETVQSVLGNAFSYLGTHPQVRDQLVAKPELIPSGIEEFLRYESPINAGRTAVEDVELNGQHIKEGERVMLVTGAAGRDAAVFPNPDEVILDRTPNRHLAFANGAHRCMGSHVARLELKVAFEEIHRRIPGYFVPEGAEVRKRVAFSRGVVTLPMVFGNAEKV